MSSTPYVSVARFRVLSILPTARVDELERVHSGFLEGNLINESRALDARLRHKYAVPFSAVPTEVERWIVWTVQDLALTRIGIDAQDPLYTKIERFAILAETQIKEAADPQSAAWNLPLKDATDPSAIAKGGPLASSDPDPFAWTDQQLANSRGYV